MTRILIVDDHPLFRQGLTQTLEREPDFSVVAGVCTAEEALVWLRNEAPDLVITDVSLPGMNGIEFLKDALTLHPELPILVMSRHDEELYGERAVRAGARGYLPKHAASDQLVVAIHRVLRGSVYLSDALKDRLLFGVTNGRTMADESPLDALSDRELEVFEMTGRGITTREASERLHLSIKTVESYRSRIKTKLGFSNGTELVKHAVSWVEGEGRQPAA